VPVKNEQVLHVYEMHHVMAHLEFERERKKRAARSARLGKQRVMVTPIALASALHAEIDGLPPNKEAPEWK